MHQISHSVIYAYLVRLTNPTNGAPVGGAALVYCMTVEAVYIVIVTYPLLAALEKKVKNPFIFRDMAILLAAHDNLEL